MPTIEVNRETGEFVIRGRLSRADFHESSSGKTTLLLSGANTRVTGQDIGGSLNIYTKNPDNVLAG